MVKTGSERSAKFSAKHDAKVIMMRLKARQEAMKQLFKAPAYAFEIVDERLKQLMELLDLQYGEYGNLSDILKNALSHYDEWSLADWEALHQKLVSLGFTEEEYTLIVRWLDATDALLDKRYDVCARPHSILSCVVEVCLLKDAEASEG